MRPTDDEIEILNASREFAKNNNIRFDEQTENMILNAMREATLDKKPAIKIGMWERKKKYPIYIEKVNLDTTLTNIFYKITGPKSYLCVSLLNGTVCIEKISDTDTIYMVKDMKHRTCTEKEFSYQKEKAERLISLA